jgi:hypothetical protein
LFFFFEDIAVECFEKNRTKRALLPLKSLKMFRILYNEPPNGFPQTLQRSISIIRRNSPHDLNNINTKSFNNSKQNDNKQQQPTTTTTNINASTITIRPQLPTNRPITPQRLLNLTLPRSSSKISSSSSYSRNNNNNDIKVRPTVKSMERLKLLKQRTNSSLANLELKPATVEGSFLYSLEIS